MPRKVSLPNLLSFCERSVTAAQHNLFVSDTGVDLDIWYAGDLELLKRSCISIIGARTASEEGQARARRIAKELAHFGVVVVSGLAKGIDHAAHSAAIAAGGKTVAVIGTPLNKAYPAEHAELQEHIWDQHLLLSQFEPGQRTFPSDFPKRNRLMAAVSDGSIIVEASDTSGTLHQATECVRLNRWLFILQSVVDDKSLTWPAKFLKEPRVVVMKDVADIFDRLGP